MWGHSYAYKGLHDMTIVWVFVFLKQLIWSHRAWGGNVTLPPPPVLLLIPYTHTPEIAITYADTYYGNNMQRNIVGISLLPLNFCSTTKSRFGVYVVWILTWHAVKGFTTCYHIPI